MSSSVYSRLRSAFAKTVKPRSTKYKRIVKTFIPKSSSETEIQSFLEKFKKFSDSGNFRNRFDLYEATVRKLSNARQFSAIKDILEHQKQYPDIGKERFVLRLMGLFGKAKMLDEAQALFDEMPSFNCERTVVSLNALLAACVKAKDYDRANVLFKELPEKLSIKPDIFSYNTVIQALCEMGSLDSAVLMMDEMESNHIVPDVVTFNTLLNAFYRQRRISEAEKLWCLMEKKNVVANVRSYNPRLRGLVRDNQMVDAVELIEEMKAKGIKPDRYTYNALIEGFVSAQDLKEAQRWYDLMAKNGCIPDLATFNMLIPFACDKEDFDYASQLCGDSIRINRRVRDSTITRVINGLTERRGNEEARKFMKMANVSMPNLESSREFL